MVYFIKDLRSKLGMSLFTYIPGFSLLITIILLSKGPKKIKYVVYILLAYQYLLCKQSNIYRAIMRWLRPLEYLDY